MMETAQNLVPRRRRRSPAEWAALVREFEGAGESAEVFCNRHDLGRHMFNRNRQRIQRERDGASVRPGASFVEATPRAQSSAGVVIEFGEHIRLRCPASMSIESVSRLARGLSRGA